MLQKNLPMPRRQPAHDGNDYGNTYVEVNLTAQHLFMYKEGQKILESDFVSGNVSKGYTTPPGLFGLTYKQRDATLKGQGYASPVKFWMPFNGGIGFHDASWRNTFGGTIYKKSGSHGCINMPYAAAKTLFENVYAEYRSSAIIWQVQKIPRLPRLPEKLKQQYLYRPHRQKSPHRHRRKHRLRHSQHKHRCQQ